MKKAVCFLLLLPVLIALLAGCSRSAVSSALPETSPDAALPTPRSANSADASATPLSTPADAAQEPSATPLPSASPALAAIRRVEDAPVALVETGKLEPLYRAARQFCRYQSALWTYIVDPTSGQIVEIVPVNETAMTEGPALSAQTIEQQARAFILKAAPQVSLDALQPGHKQVGSNFIFRWEDRAQPRLDDGVNFPFIQVAISSAGQLLSFTNTLGLEN
jgi:hypothetical protein